MENAPTVRTLQAKSHDTNADETRTPANARVDLVRLDGFTLARLTLKPGWKWSESIKPVVKTDSCQVNHVGYAVSGQLHVRMSDGKELVIRAGDSYTIPPGHDAWIEGNETFVCIEVNSAEQFAKA